MGWQESKQSCGSFELPSMEKLVWGLDGTGGLSSVVMDVRVKQTHLKCHH